MKRHPLCPRLHHSAVMPLAVCDAHAAEPAVGTSLPLIGWLLASNHRWRELYAYDETFLDSLPSCEPVLRNLGQRRPEVQPEKVEAFVNYWLELRQHRRRNYQQQMEGHWYAVNDFTIREGGIVTLIYDVTDLDQVEQQLRQSQDRLKFSLGAMRT